MRQCFLYDVSNIILDIDKDKQLVKKILKNVNVSPPTIMMTELDESVLNKNWLLAINS